MASLSRRQRSPVAWLRRHRHRVRMAAFAALALADFLYPVVQNLSRWPLTVALRHAAAAPNCTAARAVGLAPAWRGEPGYYLQHHDDRDGIACEPWPRP
jgi:Excalibur calcium-binding domain